MGALIDQYDGAIFDLDGVIYIGQDVIAGAPRTIRELRRRGIGIGFATNNPARSTAAVAETLTSIGIQAGHDDVISSADVVAALAASELSPGAPVLVTGSQALVDAATSQGLAPVQNADDHPAAVIQGYDPGARWAGFKEAAFALQRGARWYASDRDMTIPTRRGILPGGGTQVAAVAAALAGQEPTVAGKPHRPLFDAARARLDCNRPIFVGDRLDTDIQGARSSGMDSLFVLSGIHGKHDLLDAAPGRRPDYIGYDLSALLTAPREATISGKRATCGQGAAEIVDGTVSAVQPVGDTIDAQLDTLQAILALAWSQAGAASHESLDVLGKIH